MRELALLTLASLVTLSSTGCGVTSPVELDTSSMGDGYTAKTALGGYWWTYVDRSGTSLVDPNTGKEDPADATATALRPGMALGNGIEELPDGNLAYHVRGYVGPEPTQLDYALNGDPYWDELYGSLCKDKKCLEYKYPASGIGWGFKDRNVPLGSDAFDKNGQPVVGVAFKMKLGPEHGVDPSTGFGTAPISIAAPMDITDVPDPSFGDQFGTAYDIATAQNAGLDSETNGPFCTFPNTMRNGKPVGANLKTCFANLKAELTPQPTKEGFTSYCVSFKVLKARFGGLSSSSNPVGKVTAILPQRLIKIQFDAYQPSKDKPTTVFDFYIDDALLLTQELWDRVCTENTQVME